MAALGSTPTDQGEIKNGAAPEKQGEHEVRFIKDDSFGVSESALSHERVAMAIGVEWCSNLERRSRFVETTGLGTVEA